MRLPRASVAVAAAGLGAVLLAGCSGGSTQIVTSAPAPTATFTTPPPCAGATGTAKPWPQGVPTDLPAPPGVKITDDQTTQDGVRIIKFTNGMSLRESVLFVVKRLPKAGYVLGRGDAEASEADAPFVHGDVRGVVRMLAVQPCKTLWLLATVKVSQQQQQPSTGSPLLPTYSPSTSPSPLPFG